jgi:hypothetical protein
MILSTLTPTAPFIRSANSSDEIQSANKSRLATLRAGHVLFLIHTQPQPAGCQRFNFRHE